MYALWSERTKKVEAVGKTLKAAYNALSQERAKDSFQIITPDEIQKKFENEKNPHKRGNGPHNYIDFSKLEKKETISGPYSGFATGFGK